jgi:catalase
MRLTGIALVVAAVAGAFAYVNGSLDPNRLTPQKLVDNFETNNGVFQGYRRNHAKGVCVVGYFENSGQAREYSSAEVFKDARTPLVGRFALAGGNPVAADSSAPVRSMALRFMLANGEQWRTGMNNMPVFPVATPEAFSQMLQAGRPDPATGKPDPSGMPKFFAAHPESAPFLQWVKSAKPSASYASETYNGLNAFYLVGAGGKRQAVRWSVVPLDPITADVATAQDPNVLEQDLARRLAAGPLRWQLRITLGNPEDPTNDASKTWPADRTVLTAGTVVLQSIQPQNSGECRDINYDPLILPSGIEGSDDPLLAARSAVYANAYLRRASEVDKLPAVKVTQESSQ